MHRSCQSGIGQIVCLHYQRYLDYEREFGERDMVIRRENICSGTIRKKEIEQTDEIASRIVTGWINSPGHRANMLANEINWQGTGVFIIENKYYANQILGN